MKKGQFQIFYKSGADLLEYQPDFVAETSDVIYMVEPKARNEMDGDRRRLRRNGFTAAVDAAFNRNSKRGV